MGVNMIYESYSADDTKNIAKEIADTVPGGSTVILDGDLGAGKTVFASGFAAAKGYTGHVSSPTFTLVNEYDCNDISVYHFDMYRISDGADADTVGIDDYLFSDGICLIEWAENIASLLPDKCFKVTIAKDMSKGEDYRLITFERE